MVEKGTTHSELMIGSGKFSYLDEGGARLGRTGPQGGPDTHPLSPGLTGADRGRALTGTAKDGYGLKKSTDLNRSCGWPMH